MCRFGGYSDHPVVQGIGWLGGCEINCRKTWFPSRHQSGQRPANYRPHSKRPSYTLSVRHNLHVPPGPMIKIQAVVSGQKHSWPSIFQEWSLIVPIWGMHRRQEGSGGQSSGNDQLPIPALRFYHILFQSTLINSQSLGKCNSLVSFGLQSFGAKKFRLSFKKGF